MSLSQSKKRRLIPLNFHILEILCVASLENTIAVSLMISNELLVEAGISSLLPVEYLHDLGLVHENICEIKCFLHLINAIVAVRLKSN